MKYTRKLIEQKFRHKEKLKYIFFWGHHSSTDGCITKACFSQWWECEFEIDGITYHTSEQYMMSQKALLFGDTEINEEIMKARHPKQFKDLGRKVNNFNEQIWNENCCDIVLKGNYAKFSQNERLKYFLLNTNDRVLVEASPYDKIWGIGMSEDNPKCENPIQWNGTNFFGFCLMEIRDMLREKK